MNVLADSRVTRTALITDDDVTACWARDRERGDRLDALAVTVRERAERAVARWAPKHVDVRRFIETPVRGYSAVWRRAYKTAVRECVSSWPDALGVMRRLRAHDRRRESASPSALIASGNCAIMDAITVTLSKPTSPAA